MGNKVNISILAHADCCGCMACGDICPVRCISFRKDEEGFLYPEINEKVCVSCGKCASVCPELNVTGHPVAESAEAAYAESSAARQSGSSGGVFGLLAREILDMGGHAYGAAFDENLKLKHRCATNREELHPLMKSKYLQSFTAGVYKEVVKDVRSGRMVLFAGTPCQCNAVSNVVGRDCRNLLTVEVVCHGVPSQDLFDRTIKWMEDKEKSKIVNFTFRSKYPKALHPQAFTYISQTKSNNKTVNGLHYQNPFYFGFQKYITLRPSCYRCKWARPERCADITLGDFWGIEKHDPSLDPKTEVSQVILNTPKGKEYFNTLVEKDLVWCKSFPISVALESNGCLTSPTREKPERAAFFADLASRPFDEVVREHLQSKRRLIFDLYYGMPGFLRRIIRKLMDKRMSYE